MRRRLASSAQLQSAILIRAFRDGLADRQAWRHVKYQKQIQNNLGITGTESKVSQKHTSDGE